MWGRISAPRQLQAIWQLQEILSDRDVTDGCSVSLSPL